MSGILSNLKNTVIAGFVLTVVMIFAVSALTGDQFAVDRSLAACGMRRHVDRTPLVFQLRSDPQHAEYS